MEKTKPSPFCALLSRMKYITRWGLMRSSRPETLSEHTAETAHIAHMLGLLAALRLGQADIRPETLAVAALYHDATEILTGDMPTPVKYKNEALKTAYKEMEKQSARQLAGLLPADLAPTMESYLTGELLTPGERLLLKAADRISALIKCLEEESSGNTEFASAKQQQLKQLAAMHCPAADLFLAEFLPCYAQTLDQLSEEH